MVQDYLSGSGPRELELRGALLTLALDMHDGGALTFNQVALPLLGAALLGLTLLLYLRTVPLRWIEHGFFLVAAATFLAKFGSLALPASRQVNHASVPVATTTGTRSSPVLACSTAPCSA